MTPMTTVLGTEPYPSVFIAHLFNAFPDYVVFVVSLAIFLLAGFITAYFAIGEPFKTLGEKLTIGISGTIAVGSLITTIMFGIISTNEHREYTHLLQEQVANMNTAIHQKYDATLTNQDTGNYNSDDGLIKGNYKFDLSFPDGATGSYYIKWNKDTNEPTIIEKPSPPTAQELNQNANKH